MVDVFSRIKLFLHFMGVQLSPGEMLQVDGPAAVCSGTLAGASVMSTEQPLAENFLVSPLTE